ncbi:ATP synthase F1 subunit epsilon [Aquihabitans sp. G128]|uniref:ATP synthase F1 subunit epsilon n=1 Tax=Aquihabitans sp. G128 TaxID=2849779 RepID=UPI001C23F455|nr:ATP synthase F1 subunit epsilon [Aquihabitans sp. G128]QXC63160.1 ATP synthase F1 subunit epsilon [Aquihabitans sp. G128]
MTLKVQVVSPERILWSGEAEMVTARTVEGGDISFLTGHAPFVGALEIGKVIVRPEEGADVTFAVHGGFVEVSNDEVSLLTDVAESAELIDAERAAKARDAAKAATAADSTDAEAQAALRRAELRLDVAGVSSAA